ncbi:hypothetical protein OROMI_027711 [Orobanche minor]
MDKDSLSFPLCSPQSYGEMSKRQTITRNDLEEMARGKITAIGSNRGQMREKVSLGMNKKQDAVFNEVANEKHLHFQGFNKKSHQCRMRGFTNVPQLWVMSSNQPGYERKEIEINEHDKPIGPNKSDFAEFLGSIAKNGKLAPLKYLKWTDEPDDDKNAILVHVKEAIQLSPRKQDKGQNDIYSQVLGEDKGGRVRIYGTTSRIYGGTGQSDIQRINKENEVMKKKMEEQEKLIQRLLKGDQIKGNGDDSNSTKVSSPSTSDNSLHAHLPDGSARSSSLKCGFEKHDNFVPVCRKSYVVSINPSKLVGSEELGED